MMRNLLILGPSRNPEVLSVKPLQKGEKLSSYLIPSISRYASDDFQRKEQILSPRKSQDLISEPNDDMSTLSPFRQSRQFVSRTEGIQKSNQQDESLNFLENTNEKQTQESTRTLQLETDWAPWDQQILGEFVDNDFSILMMESDIDEGNERNFW